MKMKKLIFALLSIHMVVKLEAAEQLGEPNQKLSFKETIALRKKELREREERMAPNHINTGMRLPVETFEPRDPNQKLSFKETIALRKKELREREERMLLNHKNTEIRFPIEVNLPEEEQLQIALALSAAETGPETVNQTPEKPPVLKETKILTIPSNLADLARYIRARPQAIQSQLSSILEDTFQFIDMPFCALAMAGEIQLPEDPLGLEKIKGEARVDFERYCRDKEFNYDIALPLFSHFWKGIINNPCFGPFSGTYEKIRSIITGNKQQIDRFLSKTDAPEGEAAFKELIRDLGITGLYEQLKKCKDEICTYFIIPLKSTPLEQLLAEGPQIDTLLLGKKKAELNQFQTPEVEEKKPRIILRPALDSSILDFQNRLHKEFEERQRNRGDETVMAYGNIVAKHFHKEIENQINGLWKLMDLSNVLTQSIPNIEEIIALHDLVKGKEDLEHSGIQSAAIKSTLETSFNRHTKAPMKIYLTDKTQYDYLLMVSSQVSRFNQAFRQENKDLANTLLGIFFDALIEQQGKCQAGMTGRLLMIHKITLDMLIEYYNTPLKL